MYKEKTAIEVVSEDTEEELSRAESEEALVEHAGREARLKLYERQRELLTHLLDKEVLRVDDFFDMVRLGIIAMNEDLVPCKDYRRMSNTDDWSIRLERHLQRKAAGTNAQPPSTESSFSDYLQGEEHHLSPSEYTCPLISAIFRAEQPLPCIEARKEQRRQPWHTNNAELLRALDDPEDPVNETSLRPCLIFGEALIHDQLIPMYHLRQEARRRRAQAGKPEA